MGLTVLTLLCLFQVWPTSSRFVFEFELVSVDTIDYQTCDIVQPQDVETFGPCEPYLSIFCLREGTNTESTDVNDCSLGSSNAGIIAYTPPDLTMSDRTRPGLPSGPINRTFMSQEPWPVRHIRSL